MNKTIAIIGFFISTILITFFSNIILILKDFGEKHISNDHHIELGGINFLKAQLSFLIIMIIISSIFVLLNLHKKVTQLFLTFIDFPRIKFFFLKDAICNKKNIPLFLLITSSSFAVILHFHLLLYGEPTAEGVIEKYSSSLFLISGLILIITSIQVHKNLFPSKKKKQIITILILLSGLFIFLFGEEISWGQRIFNWETFGVFNDYNYQKETNSHNFFNPLYKFIYPIVGLGSFIFLFFIWFFPNKKSYLFQLFVPPPSLFFLIFFMACSSYRGHSEVYEELLAMFILLYSIRLFICLNSKDNRIENT